jgi:hypothetical protein
MGRKELTPNERREMPMVLYTAAAGDEWKVVVPLELCHKNFAAVINTSYTSSEVRGSTNKATRELELKLWELNIMVDRLEALVDRCMQVDGADLYQMARLRLP